MNEKTDGVVQTTLGADTESDRMSYFGNTTDYVKIRREIVVCLKISALI
jgi:hypothetical protein